MGSVRSWLGERMDLGAVTALARKKTVPLHRYTVWYYLGGMTLFFFLVQVMTGILLMLYYRPSADQAFESVKFIMGTVPFGWLIRSIHSWSANLMVGAAFLHLFSVYFLRAYRKPREITWLSGVFLLFLTLGFGFSGYLLPWNSLAFFATRVGTDVAGSVPLVGEWFLRFLRGGDHVTGGTLSRFYGWHVAILPALTTVLLGLHLLMVQRQGMSLPPQVASEGGRRLHMPFLPNFILRDLVGWCVALAVLASLAAIFPWELGQKADPFAPAFANIRPEWYFMFMFETLKLVPGFSVFGLESESLVILAFGLGAVLLILVPFLDRAVSDRGDSRLRLALGWLAVAYVVLLTAKGYHAWWIALLSAALLIGILVYQRAAGIKYRNIRNLLPVVLAVLLRAASVSLLALLVLFPGPASAEEEPRERPAAATPSSCEACHGSLGEDDPAMAAPLERWTEDIHYERGLGCVGCHGGDPDPALSDDPDAMDEALGYVGSPDRSAQAEFCGRCHSDVSYMRGFNPGARVDQVVEYRDSAHGRANAAGDGKPATCTDCHGVHGILPVSNTNSPVYVENVPETCGRCHGDSGLMAAYALSPTVHEEYMASVHARALFDRGDTGAPACNDCHGNHGAAPPGVESVSNVCGQCHAREATLFRASFKKDLFDEMGQSECDVCHGHHAVAPPTIEMLNPEGGSVCMECHEVGDACYEETGRIYGAITDVQTLMKEAQETLERSERAGVEVSEAVYKLKKEGVSTLVNAKALIHSFDTARLLEEAAKARVVAEESHASGLEAQKELRNRRAGLVAALALAVLVIAALALWIRRVDRRNPLVVEETPPPGGRS
jgi:cytochrome b6